MCETFIVLDSETTGLLVSEDAALFAQPHMIEFYAAKVDAKTFEIIDEIETFVNPLVPIEPFITKINGIDDEMVEDAPTFVEIYDDLCEFFLGSEMVLGQNTNFDMDVLRFELKRLGFEFNFPYPKTRICTIEMSFPMENKRLSLDKLYKKATGENFEGHHRAKEDSLATLTVYQWLLEEGF